MAHQVEGTGTKHTGQIARAAGTVMAAFVLSRVLGLAREVVISSRFGTSGELDAYLAAFRLPDILFQLMAGGALASAFIPTFAGMLAKDDEDEAWHLACNVINILLLVLSLASALCAIFAAPLVHYMIAPGFDPQRQALTVSLMRIMLLTPAIFAISGVFMGILNSYSSFLAPALAPSAYNLCIILGALLLSPHLGVYGLALGVAVGSILHYLVQLPQIWRRCPRYHYSFGWHSPAVREVVRLMLPRTLGLAVVQINFLVNTILASRLPAGSLAALNFAWMLMLLPQGIFAQGIATVVFPTFSAMAARQEAEQMRLLLLKALRAVFYLAIPATVGLILLRTPIVSLLFQRRAFDAQSVQAVAPVLLFYSLGLCAHSAVEIIARAYYALHDTKTPVAIGVGAMLLNVLLSLLLIGPFKQSGLALANSIATWLEAITLWVVLGRRLPGLELRPLLPALNKVLLASSAMALVLLLCLLLPLSNAAIGAFGIAAGAVVYFLVGAALRVPETDLVLDQLRQRLGKRSA